jgi:hypothetical protein
MAAETNLMPCPRKVADATTAGSRTRNRVRTVAMRWKSKGKEAWNNMCRDRVKGKTARQVRSRDQSNAVPEEGCRCDDGRIMLEEPCGAVANGWKSRGRLTGTICAMTE